MRKVGIHFAQNLRTICQTSGEAGRVGGAQPQLLGSMENVDALVDREAIGDIPGSVGRTVVDDQQSGSLLENRGRYRLDVVCLVVSR